MGIETSATCQLPAEFHKMADTHFGAFIRLRAERPDLDLLRAPLATASGMAMQRIAWYRGLSRNDYRIVCSGN